MLELEFDDGGRGGGGACWGLPGSDGGREGGDEGSRSSAAGKSSLTTDVLFENGVYTNFLESLLFTGEGATGSGGGVGSGSGEGGVGGLFLRGRDGDGLSVGGGALRTIGGGPLKAA